MTSPAYDRDIAVVYRTDVASITLCASGTLKGVHKELSWSFSYSSPTVDVRVGIDHILMRMAQAIDGDGQ